MRQSRPPGRSYQGMYPCPPLLLCLLKKYQGDMHNREGLSLKRIWTALCDYDLWPLYILYVFSYHTVDAISNSPNLAG
jgi:hypothetical protein